MPDFGLDKYLLEKLISLIIKYESIDKAVIFGSRARGTHNPTSDIDIAIYSENPNIVSQLRSDYEDSSIPYFADFIDYRTSSMVIKEEIDREGIVVFEK